MVSEESKLYGVCKVSVASVYQKPDHSALMLTQVLFGEFVAFIKRKNKRWFKVEFVGNGTIGWIDPLHFFFSEKISEKDTQSIEAFSLDLIHGLYSNHMTIPICIGSNLANCDGINVKMPFGKFQFTGQIINLEQTNNSKTLLCKIASRYLHAPYLKNGRSPLGIDAAGLVHMAFKMIGIQLPRTIQALTEIGEDIGFTEFSDIGDLAFFADKNNQIVHVGFVVEPMRIIHVHGRVKIDKLDNQGIYDLETKKYTYKLRTVRRLLR